MNTHFKSALNKIVAEDDLVEKTELFLRANLENSNNKKARSAKQMKKLLVASIAAVFVIGGFIGGFAYLKTPVAYISLDINPSVELGINALNNVVTVEGVNQDGETLLEGQDIINTNVSDALSQLIGSASDKSYINDEGTTVVSITAESDDEDRAAELSDIGEKAVNSEMDKRKVSVVVYKDCSDLSLRTEAKELGISPGKYKLIKNLQALDPTLTVEQLKDAKVSDIMLRARQLIAELDTEEDYSDSPKSKEQKEAIKKFKDTANEAHKRVNEAVKAAFEDAKKQAKDILNSAKAKAEELRAQAKALLKSTKGMTGAEKAAIVARAEELLKQAEVLINAAGEQADELRAAADKQKGDAIRAAERLREAAKSDRVDDDNVDEADEVDDDADEVDDDDDQDADEVNEDDDVADDVEGNGYQNKMRLGKQ